MTSIGIIVGAATIVMVIAIGRGGQMDVEDQFKNLNAGAIDISYEGAQQEGGTMERGTGGDSSLGGGMPGGAMSGGGMSSDSGKSMRGGDMPSDSGNGGGPGGSTPDGNGFGGGMDMPSSFGNNGDMSDRINQEKITLSIEDVDDIETFVPNISSVTISYSTKNEVEGGELEEAQSYTIAGVKSNYESISNLELSVGEFITDSNDENKEKVCVLGANVAKEIFGSAIDAYDSILYIDGRPYVVNGILETMGTVSSGISPDDAIFIPYETGIKYLTGEDVNPSITVIADSVDEVDNVIEDITAVLAESYPNTEFTYTDAGSKMEAASASNEILTMLLIAMAVIVFLVGGIGIMNVLFVSVKERTNEIGVLKSMGCPKKCILQEFLMEAAFISLIGGVIGSMVSLLITPLVEKLGVRVELSATAFVTAIGFALFTGIVFGFYPAWKASKLVPVEALNAE